MNKHMKTRMQHEIGSLYQNYNNIHVVFQPEKNIHKITIQNNKDTIVFLVNDMTFHLLDQILQKHKIALLNPLINFLNLSQY